MDSFANVTRSRYYDAEGLPYYHNRETGDTQWEPPQASPLPSPIVAAEGPHDTGFATGQAVHVQGHPEIWDVVRVDRGLIQVQLRGLAIKKTHPAHQLVLAGADSFDQSKSNANAAGTDDDVPESNQPDSTAARPPQLSPAPAPSPPVASTEIQKIRVLVADTVDSESDCPGVVFIAPSASLVDIRQEITEDGLEVPSRYSFVVDGDVVKSTQERKVRAEHLIAHGNGTILIIPGGALAATAAAAEPPPQVYAVGGATGEQAAMNHGSTAVDRGENSSAETVGELPVLAGHLSKCGQMPFSAWQKRYFRLSNGTLSYFAAPDDQVAKGSVVIDETCTVDNAGEKYKKKFCFEICSWKSPLALCAECEEDCELWKTNIVLTVNTVIMLAAQKGIKRGLVDKRDSGFMRKWREKWAVLNRTTLSIYDTPDDPSRQRIPVDEYELTGATVEVAASSAERNFCFTVIPSQREPVELSTDQKDELADWVRMLRSNIDGTTVSVAAVAQSSWGVQSSGQERRAGANSAGWFDVKGIKAISVVNSRQRRIDGAKNTDEYYIQVAHSCASMSWHVSRTLQDILDLHEAMRNTDPTTHGYLDKFLILPREKRSKTLNVVELEQHRKLIQVYIEEAMINAGTVEHSALGALLCPTEKGFDQHRGCLTIQRKAHSPFDPQTCWCEVSTADHTFAWSLHSQEDDGKDSSIRVSLVGAIMVTQGKLLKNKPAAFELILPERGIRIVVSIDTDDAYATTQWIECLRTEVLHVISDSEGSSLLTGDSMFAVEITPGISIPWLGAQTPDHTASRNDRLSFLPKPSDDRAEASLPVRIVDPQLLARWRTQDGVNESSESSDEEDDEAYDDDDSGEEHDDDADSSGQPMASTRRLSASMYTSDAFMRHTNSNDAVVLDTGSYAIKAGLACDSFPSVVQRSYDLATGMPLFCREQVGGATAEAVITQDWDAVTNVWDEIFHSKLGIQPSEHNFVLTEAPDMTRVSKEAMAEIMFESFGAPAITIQNAGVLALYAEGIWTGVVVDCGNRTKITPVYDGTVIPHAVMQSGFGGVDIDNYLKSMLVERHGPTYGGDTSKNDMQHFKEQSAFVMKQNPSATASGIDLSSLSVKYRMSTGSRAHLQFDHERYLCSEKLFTVGLPNGCKGLPAAIQWSIQKCESVLRKDLFGSIVLCGGTTCLDGFAERMEHETTELLQNRGGQGNRDRAHSASDLPKVKIRAPQNRKYTAWLGGASLAQIDSAPFVTADDWDEHGPAALDSTSH